MLLLTNLPYSRGALGPAKDSGEFRATALAAAPADISNLAEEAATVGEADALPGFGNWVRKKETLEGLPERPRMWCVSFQCRRGGSAFPIIGWLCASGDAGSSHIITQRRLLEESVGTGAALLTPIRLHRGA